jgi:hypothetical protein
MTDFQVLITHPLVFDVQLYSSWLQGFDKVGELANDEAVTNEQWPLTSDDFHVLHQYRLFSMMIHYLEHPKLFVNQISLDFSPEVKLFLIEK